jgi:hypothetical protein
MRKEVLILIPTNGMPADQLPYPWQKSRLSNPSGNCVEVAVLPDGGRAVRNSRDPRGPALVFNAGDWAAFAPVATEL